MKVSGSSVLTRDRSRQRPAIIPDVIPKPVADYGLPVSWSKNLRNPLLQLVTYFLCAGLRCCTRTQAQNTFATSRSRHPHTVITRRIYMSIQCIQQDIQTSFIIGFFFQFKCLKTSNDVTQWISASQSKMDLCSASSSRSWQQICCPTHPYIHSRREHQPKRLKKYRNDLKDQTSILQIAIM